MPRRPDVTTIIGTRPEAIKMAPVLRALEQAGLISTLICTGQHPGLDLPGAGVMQATEDPLDLDVCGIDADTMCERIEQSTLDRLRRDRPRLLLVQGDTNSAVGAARAARRCGIPVGHVEAGLRTHVVTDPWPEERNRVEIDSFAALLFAPTARAADNLRAENVPGEIILSGNSGIDALLDVSRAASRRSPSKRASILVTVHRRENRGSGIAAVGAALRHIASKADADIVVPLHPNPVANAQMIAATAGIPRIRLLPPQSYTAMVGLILDSRCILTDSGGLQEEGPALGRPVLVLRASTERPEAIATGNVMLVGTDPDRIAEQTLKLLHDDRAHADMSRPAFPFGIGGAAPIIARSIVRFLDNSEERSVAAAALDPPPTAA